LQAPVENDVDMKTIAPVILLPASNLIPTSRYHQIITTTLPPSSLSLVVAFIELLHHIST
jgi:hypothetical protein